MYFKEETSLLVENSLGFDPNKPIKENSVSDLKVKNIRAVYPMIKAINANRLTNNHTFYSAPDLVGMESAEGSTGYHSFTRPYGKPIITNHDLETEPIGRVVVAGYKKRDGSLPQTKPSNLLIPGTVEGSGALCVVPAITDEQAIGKVLGSAYHTVSIGANVDKVIESVSGKDLVKLRKEGKDIDFHRGQVYDGKLSYWNMHGIRGVEVSFVNNPSDQHARVMNPDIGEEGIRLLLGEKKVGSKEFSFYDANTFEKVELFDEFSIDESFLVDSAQVGANLFWFNGAEEVQRFKESCENLENPGIEPVVKPDEIQEEEHMEINIDELNLRALKSAVKKSANQERSIIYDLEKVNEVASLNKNLIASLSAGEDMTNWEFSNSKDFKTICETVSQLFDENWDEQAAKLALYIYDKEGYVVQSHVDSEVLETYGDLFLLEETDEDYSSEAVLSTKARKDLSPSVFCGPGRSFPVPDKAHAVAAMRLIGRYKGADKEEILACIKRKAKKFGVGGEMDSNGIVTIEFYPILIHKGDDFVAPYSITNVGTLEEFKNSLDETLSLYLEDEDEISKAKENCQHFTDFVSRHFKAGKVSEFVSATESEDSENPRYPVRINENFLLDYFLNKESEDKFTKAALVGLVKKLKIKREDLETAERAYSVFGSSILNRLLNSALTEADSVEDGQTTSDGKNTEETGEPVVTTIETIPQQLPVEKSNESGSKASKNIWIKPRVKPGQSNGKKTKENK